MILDFSPFFPFLLSELHSTRPLLGRGEERGERLARQNSHQHLFFLPYSPRTRAWDKEKFGLTFDNLTFTFSPQLKYKVDEIGEFASRQKKIDSAQVSPSFPLSSVCSRRHLVNNCLHFPQSLKMSRCQRSKKKPTFFNS